MGTIILLHAQRIDYAPFDSKMHGDLIGGCQLFVVVGLYIMVVIFAISPWCPCWLLVVKRVFFPLLLNHRGKRHTPDKRIHLRTHLTHNHLCILGLADT